MSKPEVKPIFDRYFVTVKLIIQESTDKKHLENPGGQGLKDANGGKNAGLPFFYFADAKGKPIVSAIRPAEGADKGGNVGCPYEPQEIAWFMEMLKRAAPKMAAPERAAIQTAFEALKKGG